MSSSTRNNTFDERYAAPLEASRRGAHRARRNPLLGVLPFALVLIVVLGVAFGAFTVFGSNPSDSSAVSGADLDGNEGSVSAAPTGAATSSPAVTQSPSVTESPSATDSSPASIEIDRSVKVVVYNGSGTSGLARKASQKLTGRDWTESSYESTTETAETTTVYYGKSSLEATAQAIAEDLGGSPALKKSSSQAPSGIAVMIGADYEE